MISLRSVLPCAGLAACIFWFGCAASRRDVEYCPELSRFKFLWKDVEQMNRLFAILGLHDARVTGFQRDSSGRHLFVRFELPGRSNMVVTLSATQALVSPLRGFGWVDDSGKQSCWLDLSDNRWHFSGGYVLPDNRYVTAVSGDYAAISDKPRTREWIARVESPADELVSLPPTVRVTDLRQQNNALYIFYLERMTNAPPAECKDAVHIAKYALTARSLRPEWNEVFPRVSILYDIDPEGKVVALRSSRIYFARASFVLLDSGRKVNLHSTGNQGVFLDPSVVAHLEKLVGQQGQARKGSVH
jgi:hypothetical protein